jgi:hypothetical protein
VDSKPTIDGGLRQADPSSNQTGLVKYFFISESAVKLYKSQVTFPKGMLLYYYYYYLENETRLRSAAIARKISSLINILYTFKAEIVLACFCDLLHILAILHPLQHLSASWI